MKRWSQALRRGSGRSLQCRLLNKFDFRETYLSRKLCSSMASSSVFPVTLDQMSQFTKILSCFWIKLWWVGWVAWVPNELLLLITGVLPKALLILFRSVVPSVLLPVAKLEKIVTLIESRDGTLAPRLWSCLPASVWLMGCGSLKD
jgi:hypothetical protein